MGWSTIFKYWSLAMEATEQAALVFAKVSEAKSPDSPGGLEITKEEKVELIESLDDNFSVVITRICQESGIPVKSVSVIVDME